MKFGMTTEAIAAGLGCKVGTLKCAFQGSAAGIARVAMSRPRQRTEANGMNEAAFVTKLLEVIAQDDLFDAMLDNGKGAA